MMRAAPASGLPPARQAGGWGGQSCTAVRRRSRAAAHVEEGTLSGRPVASGGAARWGARAGGRAGGGCAARACSLSALRCRAASAAAVSTRSCRLLSDCISSSAFMMSISRLLSNVRFSSACAPGAPVQPRAAHAAPLVWAPSDKRNRRVHPVLAEQCGAPAPTRTPARQVRRGWRI
jgi:hypothetical protein